MLPVLINIYREQKPCVIIRRWITSRLIQAFAYYLQNVAVRMCRVPASRKLLEVLRTV